MSKKILNESAIINELKESSLFFQDQAQSPTIPADQEDLPRAPVNPPASSEASKVEGSLPRSASHTQEIQDQGKENEEKLDSNHASKLASNDASMINDIRKVVKTLGKEVSFVRLTADEKNQLVDLVYTYKRQGVKTSENEINRIAVNFLLKDYQANGELSILAKVLAALLA